MNRSPLREHARGFLPAKLNNHLLKQQRDQSNVSCPKGDYLYWSIRDSLGRLAIVVKRAAIVMKRRDW